MSNRHNSKSKALLMVSRSTTKKGLLKGKNKKETKNLRAICPHHKITKNGNIKKMLEVSNDYCICLMCGARFPASLFKNDEIEEIVGDMKELNNQAKFLATATNAGNQMNDYFAEMGARLRTYKKNVIKVRNVADRQQNVKKKNKKRDSYGSSQYGKWGHKSY